jgi:acetyl-CoA synthase
MSRIIATSAINGAYKIVDQAKEILAKAIEEKGKDCKVEFPNTGYYIPIIYSMTGRAVETLADFEKVMEMCGCHILAPHSMQVWPRFLQKRLSKRASIS